MKAQTYTDRQTELLDRIKGLCQTCYPKHNWNGHLIPVVDTALRLQEKYGGDRFIVEAGAYLHDIGRILFGPLQVIKITHEVSGYHFSRFKLWQYGCEKDLRDKIAKCVLEHSGSGLSGSKPSSLESEIIMNADGVSPFELWLYQFGINYASKGKNLQCTKEWFSEKLQVSWDKKLTLPGIKEQVAPLYDKIKQQLEQIK